MSEINSNFVPLGLDGETFFLYVFLAAGVVLLLVIGQQTLLSVGRKRTNRKPTPVETGTNNPNNVDFEWLPKQTLANISKFFTGYIYYFLRMNITLLNNVIYFQISCNNHQNNQNRRNKAQSKRNHRNRVLDNAKPHVPIKRRAEAAWSNMTDLTLTYSSINLNIIQIATLIFVSWSMRKFESKRNNCYDLLCTRTCCDEQLTNKQMICRDVIFQVCYSSMNLDIFFVKRW